jgi:hypothetical protein
MPVPWPSVGCIACPSFDFSRKDTLTDEVIMHFDVLRPCVEDWILRKLDAAEVVGIDHRRIRHLLLQILK